MYLSIIILPLLSSVISGFFGRKIGVSGSRVLGCLSIITTTILAIISFFEVGFTNNPISINLFKWLDSESFNIVWNFQFDSLTVSMLIPVLVISSLVHFYSIGYMSHDPHNQRFFSYLSLFTFMMIILVTGNNYLLMFVGWEGVGVCSYLLVSFWFTRIAANQSSMSAFLTNRVGDCFLTIGMFVILWSLGNLDYSLVYSLAAYINEDIITIIGICLLIGAMAKSSQVGLHIWLPMAMEGPTPVSALIHAATMVTAGVYLLIRSSPLIEYSSTVLLICLWLGAITTVFSSLIGLFQQDIKKIIAYSTMSQLGMMVIAIGLSSYNVAIFHLINHAFYKGLLFLGAGAVIHAVVDNQDLRKYGGLRAFLPLTYTVILIASLSLVAFPFMTGFFSKDFILESAYGQYHFSSINVYVIAVIGAIFTTLYSVKVLYLTFLTNPNGPVNYYKNAHEGDIFLSLPLVILAIFSIYFGFITKDIYIGLGSGFFVDNSIFIHPLHEILIDTEFGVPTIFKLIPFILTLLFTGLGLIYSEFIPKIISSFKLSNLGYYIFGFFNQRFLIEFFYNKFIVNKILFLGGQTTRILDKGSIEWIGPYGNSVVLNKISKTISSLSKGVVTDYALYILISVCFYLFIFTFLSVFFDLANTITASCSFILVLMGSSIFYKNINSDNENLMSSVVFIPKFIKELYSRISLYISWKILTNTTFLLNLKGYFTITMIILLLFNTPIVSDFLPFELFPVYRADSFSGSEEGGNMQDTNVENPQGNIQDTNMQDTNNQNPQGNIQATDNQNPTNNEFNMNRYMAEQEIRNQNIMAEHRLQMEETLRLDRALHEEERVSNMAAWIGEPSVDGTRLHSACKTLVELDHPRGAEAGPSYKRGISEVSSDGPDENKPSYPKRLVIEDSEGSEENQSDKESDDEENQSDKESSEVSSKSDKESDDEENQADNESSEGSSKSDNESSDEENQSDNEDGDEENQSDKENKDKKDKGPQGDFYIATRPDSRGISFNQYHY